MTDFYDRALGAFLGLAIGDAMGAPVEFMLPGRFDPVTGYRAGGPFNLPSGYWTDDTSMALCLADSLIHNGGVISVEDQMTRYSNWYKNGHNSSTGKCFDIGNGTRNAIENFIYRKAASAYPASSEGNGSLMRLSPVPIVYHQRSEDEVREACVLSSLPTHNKYASDLAGEFGVLTHRALNGCDKDALHTSMVDYSDSSKVNNSGHAPESLKSALFHFHSTDSFEDAILQAVNYGNDSDTIGAITGQLAGAFYGLSAMPEDWVSDLYDNQPLLKLGETLYELSGQPTMQ